MSNFSNWYWNQCQADTGGVVHRKLKAKRSGIKVQIIERLNVTA